MTKERVDNAIKIIRHAIENNISINKACKEFGFADTYVKNVKALIYDKYENDSIDEELFESFSNAYVDYCAVRGVNTNIQQVSNDKEKTTIKGNDKSKTVEWRGNKIVDVVNIKHVKTLEDLLEVTDVDRDVWNVKDFSVNKWDVTSWKNNVPEVSQNFQVKARLEKNIDVDKSKKAVDIFKEMVESYEPPIFNFINSEIKKHESGENNLLEVSVFDLHMGKLAWHGETGENYDTKIARKRFLNAIETLAKRSQGFNISKILFPIGNDFFNSDTMTNTTTHGTPQDEDLRWQKTFKVGTRLLVDGINYLKSLGVPIDVLIVPGNHDFERSYYMGAFLEAWFNNDPAVNINNGASPRKYYRFGEVLLGFTHGSEEKEGSLPMLMANDIESKPLWSETTYHEWHLGHIHRKRNVKYNVNIDRDVVINEDLGVTVRYLSSLTGTEEWHHKKGFVGSIKAADGFIWNDKLGLIAHLNSNLNE